jgi:ribosomal protein S14
MHKSNLRKLTLSRETLRHLSEAQIRDAAGQAIDQSLQYSRCNTCGIACTVVTCAYDTCGCES